MYVNPTPAFSWGSVEEGGEATGLFRDLLLDKVDLVLGDVFGDHKRARVARYTAYFQSESGLTLVTPPSVLQK